MLNQKIKDYSRKGVVLFFCTLILGVVLRILSLSISANSLDLAQLYYSSHLDQIFFHDDETPLHYLFSIGSQSVLHVRIASLIISLIGLGFCSYLLMLKKSMSVGLILFVSWWLWPVNVVSFDLLPTVILLILVKWHTETSLRPLVEWIFLSLVQLFAPIILPLIWALHLKSERSHLRFVLSTSLPVIAYYAVKLGVFGWTNFQLPIPSFQFLIFLLPLVYLVFQKERVKSEVIYGLLGVFLIYHALFLKSWIMTPGDDQAVASFKSYTSELYERPVVICATTPQQEYYFKLKQNCQNEVLKYQVEKTPFYYFDLSGSRADLSEFLKKNAPHVEEKNFHHSRFLSVSY